MYKLFAYLDNFIIQYTLSTHERFQFFTKWLKAMPKWHSHWSPKYFCQNKICGTWQEKTE